MIRRLTGIWLGMTLFLASCGTLEIGVESTPDFPRQSATPTYSAGLDQGVDTPDLASPPIPTTTSTPQGEGPAGAGNETATSPPLAPSPGPLTLQVAYIKDGNVWFWEEGGNARPLTQGGDTVDVRLSGDGELVAFMKQDLSLWMVSRDGSGVRALLTAEDYASMVEPNDPGVIVHQFDWIPGTHLLVFNTRQKAEIGLLPNDDLHLINTESLEKRLLLPRGDGGDFFYSPDGSKLAISTSGRITLFDQLGGDRIELFTFTPIVTYSEFRFYARPAWSTDASSLRVAIPPIDPIAATPQPTSIWDLKLDGRSAQLLGTINAASAGDYSFSPDLSHILYLRQTEDRLHGASSPILLTNLATGAITTFDLEASTIYGWSPDGQHFAFLTNRPEPQAYIGTLDGQMAPVAPNNIEAEVVIFMGWVDAGRYLFLAQSEVGWDILLGEITGPSLTVGSVTGRIPVYDFAGAG